MAHFLVSASHKSSGKTTVSVGLAAALAARGLGVQTFKKGPDYIDPMWLARASGRACFNLDFNTQSRDEIRATFARHACGADVALVEGNMGLHDGVAANGADSTAALASLLEAPVVLVVDCEGMTRGVAPLVLGFQAFDKRIRIAGVILNRVASARQQGKLIAALDTYTDVAVLGSLPRGPEFTIIERHLGLTPPQETNSQHGKIDRLARLMRDEIDLDRLLRITAAAGGTLDTLSDPAARSRADVRIAIARDSAFGFYYSDDLEALQRAGARLVAFSPLADARLPEADGVFIGGGFPETHMAALEVNAAMRESIHRAAQRGLPIYAECGGLMYLSRSISWHGETSRMVGIVPADVVMHDRPQGRGLVVVEPTRDHPWLGTGSSGSCGGGRVRAHEFHYADLANVAPGSRFAWKVVRGAGIDGRNDGIVVGNVLASFTHLRDTSACRWAECFVGFVRQVKAARGAAVLSSADRPIAQALWR